MTQLDSGFEPIKRKPKSEETTEKVKNVAVKLPEDLVDKINDYGFWEAKNQTDVIEEALRTLFEGKDIKPMPEAHRKKMEANAQKRRAGMRKKKY